MDTKGSRLSQSSVSKPGDISALPPLESPPGPVTLYFKNSSYRKWFMSRFFLCVPILPSRFRKRMQRRLIKHQTAAKMARLGSSELTASAREIFRELRALQAACGRDHQVNR